MTNPPNVVLSAPMSFAGSAQRIWKLTARGPWFGALAILLVALAWTTVACWYVIVFGVFGVIAIPFRLIRRGQRQRERQAERHHHELTRAIERAGH